VWPQLQVFRHATFVPVRPATFVPVRHASFVPAPLVPVRSSPSNPACHSPSRLGTPATSIPPRPTIQVRQKHCPAPRNTIRQSRLNVPLICTLMHVCVMFGIILLSSHLERFAVSGNRLSGAETEGFLPGTVGLFGCK